MTETCPICARPSAPPNSPFCSRGCRDRDLLQWLSEGYRVPGATSDQDGLDSGDTRD